MIKGIIFDLDGAYFVWGKENFINSLVDKYKADKEACETLFYSSDLMMNYKRGKISDDAFWTEFVKSLNIKATKQELIELLLSGYSIDTKYENLVKEIHSSDYTTIICSNNFRARVDGLNQKYLFLLNFDVKVFSYEVGALKLEGTRMYDTVIEKVSFPPEDILLVDNGEANVAHAKQYGFAALLYKDFFQLIEELNKYGIKT